jgi:hypothetical protein
VYIMSLNIPSSHRRDGGIRTHDPLTPSIGPVPLWSVGSCRPVFSHPSDLPRLTRLHAGQCCVTLPRPPGVDPHCERVVSALRSSAVRDAASTPAQPGRPRCRPYCPDGDRCSASSVSVLAVMRLPAVSRIWTASSVRPARRCGRRRRVRRCVGAASRIRIVEGGPGRSPASRCPWAGASTGRGREPRSHRALRCRRGAWSAGGCQSRSRRVRRASGTTAPGPVRPPGRATGPADTTPRGSRRATTGSASGRPSRRGAAGRRDAVYGPGGLHLPALAPLAHSIAEATRSRQLPGSPPGPRALPPA